ncbi:MAG: ABC transporter ATP-binding protein [bacterium]|nr:ABC transporter ATP-binding protein [bacterium]
MKPVLGAQGVAKIFPRSDGDLTVLAACDLLVGPQEAVAITGASGSGKSTLLNILGGLDAPTSGSVTHEGWPLDFADHAALTRWRSEVVGFVFQFHFLLPDFTAFENLLIPLRGRRRITAADRTLAMEFLERMGLADRADHLPGEMSGGEQQRVAVARAFMNRPRVVLADEPFGNLDKEIGARLGDLLFEMRRDHGTALVIVTHDSALAGRADRRLHLHGGRLAVAGGGEEGLR